MRLCKRVGLQRSHDPQVVLRTPTICPGPQCALLAPETEREPGSWLHEPGRQLRRQDARTLIRSNCAFCSSLSEP
jgi:hypothetical protein